MAREQVNQLIQQNGWVKTGGNLLVFGASGVGKTHLVSNIGYGLAEAGIKIKFMVTTALMQLLQRAKAELKLTEALNRLDKYVVLIVDDIGYVRKTEQESSVLFELIAHRYERNSLIITSNQSFEDWDKLFVKPDLQALQLRKWLQAHKRRPLRCVINHLLLTCWLGKAS